MVSTSTLYCFESPTCNCFSDLWLTSERSVFTFLLKLINEWHASLFYIVQLVSVCVNSRGCRRRNHIISIQIQINANEHSWMKFFHEYTHRRLSINQWLYVSLGYTHDRYFHFSMSTVTLTNDEFIRPF